MGPEWQDELDHVGTLLPEVLANWAATWKSEPAERVPEERRAWFRDRVEQGIADGVRAGRRPRQTVRLGRRRRGNFKPYVSTR